MQTKYKRVQNELRTQRNQAANTYKNSIITTQDYTITSRMNGKVYALYKNPGEIVNPQQPLGLVGSKDKFLIEMLVDEVDIVFIAKGQEVIVALDAYPNENFVANVTKIYPNKDERNQTFKVEATFADIPQTLYPGLSGEGNIIIEVKKDVLIIPRDYLIGNDRVQTTTGIVEVITGLQTQDQIEIRSGISTETQLLKPDTL